MIGYFTIFAWAPVSADAIKSPCSTRPVDESAILGGARSWSRFIHSQDQSVSSDKSHYNESDKSSWMPKQCGVIGEYESAATWGFAINDILYSIDGDLRNGSSVSGH
jgi:hypothetical protein